MALLTVMIMVVVMFTSEMDGNILATVPDVVPLAIGKLMTRLQWQTAPPKSLVSRRRLIGEFPSLIESNQSNQSNEQ